ncbi:unnamed protein product [Anisakis simplex]|uniref:Transmembrane channel-like protein 1 (inferred by orthology to a C. elegans protein) n=1 Tax=Anisakis simplex TaxID=6269 RepID=A0A0M3K4E9_ANISI|nr:unnamed protein product [Anisakis simplex]
MGDTRTDAATPAEVLPRPLFSRQSLRRASVFSDLMTIFRRSTSGSSVRRKKANHARTPPIEDLKNESNQETEAFLDADASAAAATTGANEEEEEGKPMTRQVLLDKIRQKKEVIGKLRCQAWSMNRKRRTLKLAQKYLEQHESKVSKTHLYKEEFKKRWHATCRWADNIRIYLIPWEAKIKRIETMMMCHKLSKNIKGHFGSVVSSYFTFLRWVVYVNLIITLIIISFIVIPEVINPFNFIFLSSSQYQSDHTSLMVIVVS